MSDDKFKDSKEKPEPAERVYVETAAQLQQIDSLLAYDKELPGARLKLIVANHALTRVEGSFLASIDDIHPEPDLNLRLAGDDYDAGIREIADSIKQEGFYPNEPLTVFGSMRGKKPVLILVDGYRRHAGAMLAISEGCELQYLPIIVLPPETTMEDILIGMMRTSSSGSGKKKLTPYEISFGCKRLRRLNMSHEKIAQRLGYSVEYIHQLLLLAGAPRSIRTMVENGQTTAALAISTMRTHGPDAEAVLNDAMAAAKSDGKLKLTAKNMPERVFKKALTKNSAKMFDALQKVKASKQFGRLPVDARKIIDEVFASIMVGGDQPGQAGGTAD